MLHRDKNIFVSKIHSANHFFIQQTLIWHPIYGKDSGQQQEERDE